MVVLNQRNAVLPLCQVLHVGSGPPNPAKLHQAVSGDDWQEIRLDVDPTVSPNIVASMTDMPMIAQAAMDAIWYSHNLEHLYHHEVEVALAEFLRVLKPGGFAPVRVKRGGAFDLWALAYESSASAV